MRRSRGEGTVQTVRRKGKPNAYRGKVVVDGQALWGPLTEKRSQALPLLWQKLEKIVEAEPPRLGPKLSSSFRILLENRLAQEWRRRTVSLGYTVLAHVEARPLGEMGVLEIQPQDILGWRLSLGVGASAGHRYQLLLERVLSLLGNPVKADKPRLSEPDIRVLSRPEQRELIERAIQPRTRLAIRILLELGLRNGEVCGLKHEDRHEDGIWVRRQIVEDKGQIYVETLKTDESRAWLPLGDLVEEIGPPRKGYVLATANATPMRPSNLRRMVQSVAEGTDFEGITPHELRHTAAVNLLRAGVDPRTAASITRHSVETLLLIYHRVSQDGKIEAFAKLKKWREVAG